jgi:hypothetical protein
MRGLERLAERAERQLEVLMKKMRRLMMMMSKRHQAASYSMSSIG